MKSIPIISASLLLASCAAHAQYRVVVPGTGQLTAFIAENPTKGASNGSCFTIRSADPSTGVLHDTARMCGAFDATGYNHARLTIQTVTGDSAYQTNTTFLDQGMILGGTTPPSWFTPGDYYQYLFSPSGITYQIIEGGSSGASQILRDDAGGTDQKGWETIVGGSGDLHFRLINDVYGAVADWLTVQRSGMTPSSATFAESILFGADNTYNVGSSSVAAKGVFAQSLSAGRASALQGTVAIYNTSGAGPFQMSGTNGIATSGADIAVGYVFGASSIYPLNSSVQLGYSGGRYQKMWTVDLDISGTCTGCASGANTALSNLTNPTAVNQNLLPGSTGLNLGSTASSTSTWHDLFSLKGEFGFPATTQGAVDFFNSTNTSEFVLLGTATTGADLEATNTSFGAGSFFGTSNITLGNASFPWSTIYGTAYVFNGSNGGSSTITVRNSAGTGTCTITFTAGGFISSTC